MKWFEREETMQNRINRGSSPIVAIVVCMKRSVMWGGGWDGKQRNPCNALLASYELRWLPRLLMAIVIWLSFLSVATADPQLFGLRGEPLALDYDKLRAAQSVTFYWEMRQDIVRDPNEVELKRGACIYKTEDSNKVADLVNILINGKIETDPTPDPEKWGYYNKEQTMWNKTWGIYFKLAGGAEAKFLLGGSGGDYLIYLPQFEKQRIRANYDIVKFYRKIRVWTYDLGQPTVIDPSVLTVQQCESFRRQLLLGRR